MWDLWHPRYAKDPGQLSEFEILQKVVWTNFHIAPDTAAQMYFFSNGRIRAPLQAPLVIQESRA